MIVQWTSLLALLLFLLTAADAVHVGQVECGGTIPIDSTFLLDPSWSLTPYRKAIQTHSGTGIQFSSRGLSARAESLIESEAGADPAFVVVFQVSNRDSASTCTVLVDPLKSGLAGRVVSSVRLVAINMADNSSQDSCPADAVISIATTSTSLGNLTVTSGGTGSTSFPFTHSASFPISENDLPLSLAIPTGCHVQLLVLVNRAGSIKPWYVWIPTTVYSGLVTLVVLPHLFFARSTPTAAGASIAFLVFLGYLGSMIGLIVEVVCWQSSLGRMFPFPSSVTLYCCLVVLYSLYLLLLLIRHPHRRLMLVAAMRLLVYGANVSLCVGYWISGYVVLGSLALFQYVATNCLLTAYYAYTSVRLKRAAKRELPVSFSRALAYMWLAPATPFAVCALFYVDIHLASTGGKSKSAVVNARLADAVYLYNVQVSIPLLLVQNVYGVALLAAATAFHMPFLVVLFPLLLFFILQLVCAVEQYISELQRWMRRKPFRQYCDTNQKSAGTCGWLSLGTAFEFMFEGDAYRSCLERELQANALVYYSDVSNAAAPPSARRGSGWGASQSGSVPHPASTYERDMSILRQRHSASASPIQTTATFLDPRADEDVEAVYFPPLPSHSPSHRRPSPQQTPATNRSRRRDRASVPSSTTENDTMDYSTPSRRGEDFWPDSIER